MHAMRHAAEARLSEDGAGEDLASLDLSTLHVPDERLCLADVGCGNRKPESRGLGRSFPNEELETVAHSMTAATAPQV